MTDANYIGHHNNIIVLNGSKSNGIPNAEDTDTVYW